MNASQPMTDWMASVKHASDFQLEPLSLRQSNAWFFQDGVIRHASHRFFTVIGAQWVTPSGQVISQPFLEQPEVGTLGFLMRQGEAEPEVLVQAKVEPGNVGVVQLAPTCQATSSNAHQVHGGSKPPFIDLFTNLTSNIVYDVLQSEQGTRFFGKRNRNVVMLTQNPVEFSPQAHRWIGMTQLLDLLREDFLVNTDARSVLVCSPWEVLAGHQPFTKFQTGFGLELAQSFVTPSLSKALPAVKSEIQFMRANTFGPRRVDLRQLSAWQVTPDEIRSMNGMFTVRQVKITVKGREVPTWDQPIIDSSQPGKIFLECGRIGEVLHFLFRASIEPGLCQQVELTPSTVCEPGNKTVNQLGPVGQVRAECWQSEEGGRFYQDKNLFRIIDVGQAYEVSPGSYWLTLKDIKSLLQEEGWLTNEARSVLSLLLPWL